MTGYPVIDCTTLVLEKPGTIDFSLGPERLSYWLDVNRQLFSVDFLASIVLDGHGRLDGGFRRHVCSMALESLPAQQSGLIEGFLDPDGLSKLVALLDWQREVQEGKPTGTYVVNLTLPHDLQPLGGVFSRIPRLRDSLAQVWLRRDENNVRQASIAFWLARGKFGLAGGPHFQQLQLPNLLLRDRVLDKVPHTRGVEVKVLEKIGGGKDSAAGARQERLHVYLPDKKVVLAAEWPLLFWGVGSDYKAAKAALDANASRIRNGEPIDVHALSELIQNDASRRNVGMDRVKRLLAIVAPDRLPAPMPPLWDPMLATVHRETRTEIAHGEAFVYPAKTQFTVSYENGVLTVDELAELGDAPKAETFEEAWDLFVGRLHERVQGLLKKSEKGMSEEERRQLGVIRGAIDLRRYYDERPWETFRHWKVTAVGGSEVRVKFDPPERGEDECVVREENGLGVLTALDLRRGDRIEAMVRYFPAAAPGRPQFRVLEASRREVGGKAAGRRFLKRLPRIE